MESNFHPLKELFDQLGLPSSFRSIEQVSRNHGPLDTAIVLPDAHFWTRNQSTFLRDELLNDADWAEAIDLLDSQLRMP